MRNLTKTIITFKLILLFSTGSAIYSQTISVRGKLFDKEDGSIISNGTIFLDPGRRITVTNLNGEYIISCPPGQKQLSTQVLGYKAVTLEFNFNSDTVINIYLQVSTFELKEVKVIGDQVKNVRITSHGSVVVTPAALHETPRLFSEPDLLKSFQFMPGVVAGKEGSSEILVRGGSAGQNIILANGCYFFLPNHFLGTISPIDLDFLESAELYKDYFPAELGGGAASVISLEFKKPQKDSLRAQLRLGMLSSGITIELPFKKTDWKMTAGLKRGNYSIYEPLLKKIVSKDISEYLPSGNYSFYDGFLRLTKNSEKLGNFDYLFFGNHDNGKDEKVTVGRSADTLIFHTDGISSGWKNMLHALQWEVPVRNELRWKLNLNYNQLTMNQKIYSDHEKYYDGRTFYVQEASFLSAPAISNISTSVIVSGFNEDNNKWSAGVSNRIRSFTPNIIANNNSNGKVIINAFGESSKVLELATFFSSSWHIFEKLQFDAGLRISGALTKGASYIIPEPRIRLSFDPEAFISPHLNYVRLSQFDHSIVGSNAGLRSTIWIPVSKDFGPEISDVVSAGFQGQFNTQFGWNIDGYFKKITGIVDYKSGASFVFDTTFVDILDRIKGRAYGLEAGIFKKNGKLRGSVSYTYSRSKREFYIPEGIVWIPSAADRPQNFNLTLKYYFKTKTSFGINWVYQSGAPTTIYMQEASFGEFFKSKNNIRYFDYHRMDISIRQSIFRKRFSIFLDADIFNVYNRKNTFYFKKMYDGFQKLYYFKNVSLFPIMPSLTLTIKY